MRETAIFLITIGLTAGTGWSQDNVSGQNCSFRADPESFRNAPARAHRAIGERVQALDRALARTSASPAAANLGDAVDPLSLTRKNFIDDEIFNKLAAVGV